MSRFSKKSRFIQDFGGVALADILANGVVVLLVVIIITISFKKQETEQQIEQSVEISAILARDIASSLVFNDLPSSPPAILHDYHCRAPRGPWRNHYEQHDCMPWLYPMFEIHKEYVREFNTRRTFTRMQLLEEDNELDAYLRLLSSAEKQRARIDIYNVDMYYLAISILKENDIRLGHWHFLGEKEKAPASLANFIENKREDANNSLRVGDGEGEEEQGDLQGDSGDEPRDQIEEVPADAFLRSPDLMEEMLPPSESLSRGSPYTGQDASQFENGADEDASYGDSIAEALADAILDEQEGSSVFGSPSSLRIRIPSGNEEVDLFELQPGFFDSTQGQPIDYHIFMIILMVEYLDLVDQKGFDRVDIKQLFNSFLKGHINLDAHPYRPFAERLKEKMRLAFAGYGGLIGINHQKCKTCETQLFVPPNDPVEEVRLHSVSGFFPEQTSFVSTELRLYPYPHSGQFSEILKGDTILIHPETILRGGERWYVAGILDPNIEDIVLGYVYANDLQEPFGVYADINSLRLNEQRLVTSLPTFPLRNEVILSIAYSSLALFIMLFFFFFLKAIFRRSSHAKS